MAAVAAALPLLGIRIAYRKAKGRRETIALAYLPLDELYEKHGLRANEVVPPQAAIRQWAEHDALEHPYSLRKGANLIVLGVFLGVIANLLLILN